WVSDVSCDLMRSANPVSVSGAAAVDLPAAGGAAGVAVVGAFAGADVCAAEVGADAGAADADAIVRLSSTRLTPSVVRASNNASARSVSSAISPFNVTTPALVATTM